jgi:hypothetical protein
MDGRIKPSEFYTVDCNDTSNENNAENSNETMNNFKGWGEDGASIKLSNIATSIDEPITIRTDVDRNNNY